MIERLSDKILFAGKRENSELASRNQTQYYSSKIALIVIRDALDKLAGLAFELEESNDSELTPPHEILELWKDCLFDLQKISGFPPAAHDFEDINPSKVPALKDVLLWQNQLLIEKNRLAEELKQTPIEPTSSEREEAAEWLHLEILRPGTSLSSIRRWLSSDLISVAEREKALSLAVNVKRVDVIGVLIKEFGVDVNTPNTIPGNPILMACFGADARTTQLLAGKFSADVELRATPDSLTPLLLSAKLGALDVCRTLLCEFRADASARSGDGETALHLLCMKGAAGPLLQGDEGTEDAAVGPLARADPSSLTTLAEASIGEKSDRAFGSGAARPTLPDPLSSRSNARSSKPGPASFVAALPSSMLASLPRTRCAANGHDAFPVEVLNGRASSLCGLCGEAMQVGAAVFACFPCGWKLCCSCFSSCCHACASSSIFRPGQQPPSEDVYRASAEDKKTLKRPPVLVSKSGTTALAFGEKKAGSRRVVLQHVPSDPPLPRPLAGKPRIDLPAMAPTASRTCNSSGLTALANEASTADLLPSQDRAEPQSEPHSLLLPFDRGVSYFDANGNEIFSDGHGSGEITHGDQFPSKPYQCKARDPIVNPIERSKRKASAAEKKSTSSAGKAPNETPDPHFPALLALGGSLTGHPIDVCPFADVAGISAAAALPDGGSIATEFDASFALAPHFGWEADLPGNSASPPEALRPGLTSDPESGVNYALGITNKVKKGSGGDNSGVVSDSQILVTDSEDECGLLESPLERDTWLMELLLHQMPLSIINATRNTDGDTAMHVAAACGREDLLTLLTLHPASRAQIMASNKSGATPLHVACAAGHEMCASVLMEALSRPLPTAAAETSNIQLNSDGVLATMSTPEEKTSAQLTTGVSGNGGGEGKAECRELPALAANWFQVNSLAIHFLFSVGRKKNIEIY